MLQQECKHEVKILMYIQLNEQEITLVTEKQFITSNKQPSLDP